MSDPYQVVRDFEVALSEYTGAPYVVTVTSCTMALLLALAWSIQRTPRALGEEPPARPRVELPARTYVSVPMAVIHAGGRPIFADFEWLGEYRLRPYPIWDCARWLRANMYQPGQMMCLSFHPTKHLGLSTYGGAILLDDQEAASWLRRARFDGRSEGVAASRDTFNMLAFHAYMGPVTAAEGLQRLATLPKHNEPLPNDDYPDLSKMAIFS